jgi:hypothetical protein
VAIGNGCYSTGAPIPDYDGPVAIGFGCTANGVHGAVGIGYKCNSGGSGGGGTVAMGGYCDATGANGCFALGWNSSCGSLSGLALGQSCTTSGSNNMAFGEYCTASGAVNLAIGYQAEATGSYGCAAIGMICSASGSRGSLAVGSYCGSSGSYGSVALGHSVASAHNGEFAFSSNGTNWQSSDFSIGAQTTGTTQTELTTDGAVPNAIALGANPNTNRLLLEKKTYLCFAYIAARQSGGSNVAAWTRRFLVSVDTNGNGTLSAVQNIGTDIIPAGWKDVNVSIVMAANGPSGNPNVLQVLVTGLAATTINWAATVEATIINMN